MFYKERNRNGEQQPSNPPNVLVTSISKKVPLIKAVRAAVKKVSDKPKIFGADMDNTCIGSYFVDEFWQMPGIDELSIGELITYCKSNNIEVIIPTRNGELEFFAHYKSTLSDNGIAVMVSEYSTIEACLDKIKFTKHESIQDIVIPASIAIEKLNAEKFVVKERYGAGSLSIGLNLDTMAAQSHAASLTNPIFQPFERGYEITVDAYVTKIKEVKGLVMRKRVKVVNGESQVTTSFENASMQKKFIDFLNKCDFYGHITLQAIIDDADNIHLIECNPRVGGASMLSIHAGLDTFYWFYLEAMGTNISSYPFLPATKPITQVRYFDDVYL